MVDNQNNNPVTVKNGVGEVQCCNFMHIHKEIVKKVGQVIPDGEQLLNLAEFYKVFGDPTRIRVLCVLSRSEAYVCDIATPPQMGQSAIPHQLRMLKQMWLTKLRRDGRTMFYSLVDGHIETTLVQGTEHVEE